MRRFTIHLTIWLLTFAIGASASAVWRAMTSPITIVRQDYDNDEQQLLEIERRYVKAEEQHDVAFFDSVEAEDYTYTASDGTVMTKAEGLEDMRADDDYPALSNDEVKVRLYGDTAVVTGRLTAIGRDEDENYTNQTRWTDVFVKRDGRWLLVNTQVTSIDNVEYPNE